MRNQYSFSGFKTSTAFGGTLLKNKKNRTARPLSCSEHMHMTLKSSHMNGDVSLFRKENRELFVGLLKALSEKYHITIMEYKLVGNHIHLLFKIACRSLYRKFIRCLTGQFAKKMIQRYGLKVKRFFDERPFTRVVKFGRDLIRVTSYIRNQLVKQLISSLEAHARLLLRYQVRNVFGLDYRSPVVATAPWK